MKPFGHQHQNLARQHHNPKMRPAHPAKAAGLLPKSGRRQQEGGRGLLGAAPRLPGS